MILKGGREYEVSLFRAEDRPYYRYSSDGHLHTFLLNTFLLKPDSHPKHFLLHQARGFCCIRSVVMVWVARME